MGSGSAPKEQGQDERKQLQAVPGEVLVVQKEKRLHLKGCPALVQLPREMVESLEGSKNWVDVALGNMGYWWSLQCWAAGNSWIYLKGLCKLNDSMIPRQRKRSKIPPQNQIHSLIFLQSPPCYPLMWDYYLGMDVKQAV